MPTNKKTREGTLEEFGISTHGEGFFEEDGFSPEESTEEIHADFTSLDDEPEEF